MQLDSVRELKSLLTKSVLVPLSASAVAKNLSLSAQPTSDALGQHRTIALGVARKGANDFRLAVRIQRREMETSPELDLIRRKAKDEVDVRFIGQLVKRAERPRPARPRRAVPWHRKRNRPLHIGGSVGHFNITAGTLGCFVTSRADGSVLILLNIHSLPPATPAILADPMGAMMPPVPLATLEQARAAKEEALRVFGYLAPVIGVGIMRVGKGYGLKVNVREPPAAGAHLPECVAGVPVTVEVIGVIQKE